MLNNITRLYSSMFYYFMLYLQLFFDIFVIFIKSTSHWSSKNSAIYQNYDALANTNQKAMVIVFNATFNNISAISCSQFYLWRKPDYSEKTTDLQLQSYRHTLSHNAVSSTPRIHRDSNSQR